MKKKNIILIIVAFTALFSIFLLRSNRWVNANGKDIASTASNELNGHGIEHIKRTTEGKITSEHYRDLNELREIAISYKADGTLLNKTIVHQSGKRVISIGYGPEKPDALSWILAENIANENKQLLKKSLLKEIKDELNNKNWSIEKASKNNTYKVIKSKDENRMIYVYVDSLTSFPYKKELYEIVNGKEILISTEEYSIETNADLQFDTTEINTKEIQAPVTPQSTRKGN